MGLRIAGLYDIDLVANMAIKFAKETEYKNYLNEDKVRAFCQDFVLSDNAQKIVLLYEDVGLIAGAVTPCMFGDLLVATEVAWWVEPEHRKSNIGRELLDAFEFWGQRVGCKLITLSSLDESVGKYYEKRGYRLQEHAYVKEI